MQTHTTLIAAAVIAAMAGCVHAQTYSLSQGTQTIENDVSYVGDSDDRFAVQITESGNANFTGTSFSASSSYEPGDQWNAAVIVDGGDTRAKPSLILGNSATQTIKINSQGAATVGLWAWRSGQITVKGKDLVVHVTADLNKDPAGAAYGILAQNNSVPNDKQPDKATVIINAENTYVKADYVGELTEDAAIAALLAMSEGHLHINGNLYAEGRYALVARGDSFVRINESNTKTIQLIGDIDFNYDKKSSGTGANADVLVNLSNADSFWKGSATVSYGTGKPSDDEKLSVQNFQLGLSNGAQWNPTVVEETDGETSGTTQLAVNKLTFNDGIINLQTAGQTVKIQKMSGTGGTINAEATKDDDGNFVSSTVWIGEVSNTDDSTPSMTVKYTGITADDLSDVASDMESLADQTIKVGKDGTGTQDAVDQTFNVEEGNIRGAVTSGYDADGNLSTHQAKNVKLTDYGALNSMTFVQWRNEINHLTKRLGDIRASESSIGAWARVYGGESQWKSNSEIEMDHTTIQVGADYRINNHWIVGGAFSYTDSDADLVKGQAKGDSYSLAAYATYMADGGSYLDLIARYGYLDNEMTSGNMSVDTQSNAFSLSVETGHMFRIMEKAYIEPQIEVTYGFISGDDATASNGVRLDQDDFQSLITRVGVRTGFEFPEKAGTIYAMLSYSYDFLGDADGTAAQGGLREALNEDLGGGWVSYGIGAQFKLGDNAFAYGELERTSGGEIDNPYLFNVGFRWNF
ncbi:MAG TPA: autotransporter outer membrane beta-barrel domain-containing protein [Candidatus Duodenibacillus intestinigallinarum]|nr:autotransporter outer membrane beta-barrel domain-containing protein [Candidatus Duodenibacillus intestinigallinarum]